MRTALVAIGLAVAATAGTAAIAGKPADVDPALAAAVKAPTRSANNLARDPHRHPAETLAFFGVKPGQTVVEVWPAGGWYTEILAPYLKGKGTLYAADIWPNQLRGIRAKQAADAATYGDVKLAAFPTFAETDPKIPDGSVDVVVTFRNVHNWKMGYQRGGQDYSSEAFKQMFAMLKKGGTLGVEDHRLPESAPDDKERTSGYVKVSTVRKLAEAAGFHYVGASEVNANPKDTTDHPSGVWTLPPGLRLGQVDREKYVAIGESDRMTLKFRKP